MSFDTKTLKPGDKIGVGHSGGWRYTYSIQTVKSVSKTGQVTLENGDRFGSDCRMFGQTGRYRNTLVTVEEVEGNQRLEKERRDRNRRHSLLVEEVTRIVNGHKNGFGDYFPVSVVERDLLLQLVNSLEVKVEEPTQETTLGWN